MSIRQETEADFRDVFSLIEAAFRDVEISDHDEHFLVGRLRKSDAFVPELSLIATIDEKIVGHILLTKLVIRGAANETEALALAPVSVLPAHQGKGIGAKMITEAHRIAKEMGFGSILLVGHAKYYPRFGYGPASRFGIQFPFDAPDEVCMAIELEPDSLKDATGTVVYPSAFFE